MHRRHGYVLVTCLYVVAVLSVSSLMLVRSASLMASDARLLDQQGTLINEAHRALGEIDISTLDASGHGIDCASASQIQVRTQILHERTLSRMNAENELVSARFRVYGLQACASGRALIETTVGVIEPADVFAQDALPASVTLGRLSWRRVW